MSSPPGYSLGTSLTLFAGTLAPKGAEDARQARSETEDEVQFHHGVAGRRQQRCGTVQSIWRSPNAGRRQALISRGAQVAGGAPPCSPPRLGRDLSHSGEVYRRDPPRHRRQSALTIHDLLGAINTQLLPSVSTIDLILKRHGLIEKRRRARCMRDVYPVFRGNPPQPDQRARISSGSFASSRVDDRAVPQQCFDLILPRHLRRVPSADKPIPIRGVSVATACRRPPRRS